MKRIFTILCIVTMQSVMSLSAQSNALFGIKNNETNATLSILSIVEGENDNVYAVGLDAFTNEHFLIKMDDNSQLVWQKKITTAFVANFALDQITFYNNEIFFLGTVYDFPTKYLLSKADVNGNSVWSKTLHPIGISPYHVPSLSVTQNSGVIVSGSMAESIDMFSLATDGSTNWVRNFSTDSASGKNPNFDITVTDNGDIMGCGKADSDMSFYCMGSDGNVKWASRLLEFGINYTHVKSIVEVNPNKFLICGFRFSGGFYGLIDSTGNFLDLRLVTQMLEIRSGQVLNDGNILLDCQNIFGHSAYMIIDDQGALINAYSSPFMNTSTSYSGIAVTSNFKYLADGNTIKKINDFNSLECLNLFSQPITFIGEDPSTTPTAGYYAINTPGTIVNYPDLQLNTSNLQLEVACGVVGIEEDNTTSIHIFPTALNNGESIFVNHSLESIQLDYQILDLNGKVVALNTLKDNSIAITGLSAGMYLIQFAVKGNVVKSDKFVVVN